MIGTSYYDDYPTVEPEHSAGSARTCQELLMKALGWLFAADGKKALDFAQAFDVLGITCDLSRCSFGVLTATSLAVSRFWR